MRPSSYLLVLLPILAACASASDEAEPSVGSADEAITAVATVLVSGDFSSTSATKGIVTNELASTPGAKLLPVGDLSYSAPYASNYPWAGWRPKTYPVVGNHEFNSVAGTGGQQPYALFNGDNAAGNHVFPAITGGNGVATFDFAYSTEVAPGWLLVVMNTGLNCAEQSCTSQASRLTSWISTWRASHGGHGCVMVAMHTARFSTMFSGDADNLPWASGVAPIWSAAVAAHADIVMQGHVHVYEEFKKLAADGTPSATGTKLFTVGSGGRGQVKPLKSNIPTTALVTSHPSPIDGVLELALYSGSYGFHFETSATTGTPASSVACNVP